MSEGRIAIGEEVGAKKAFVWAIDWPGWCRAAKTVDLARKALVEYAPRYAPVAKLAGVTLPAAAVDALRVVDSVKGGGGTDFGVPSEITDADRRRVTAAQAEHLADLVAAAWTVFDRTAAGAPASLRKGPRGGGRDRDKMIGHVIEADHAYAREIGLRMKEPRFGEPRRRSRPSVPPSSSRSAIRPMAVRSPDRKWTPRYAARRIAWHALDHAWEMEDRSEPG